MTTFFSYHHHSHPLRLSSDRFSSVLVNSAAKIYLYQDVTPWIVSPWAPFLYRPSYATTCNQTVGPMFSKCQLSERFPRADRPTYFLSPQYQCLFLRSGTLGTTQSLAPPRLYKVALKSVTLLATSASVEHVFSSRGMFMWLHRAQVSYLIFV